MRIKQSRVCVSIAVAATWFGASAEAHAQLADATPIKPVLMLVVDTSGSMERMPGTETLPACTGNPATDANQRNRWTGALEALTGSFTNFACQQQNRTQSPYTSTDYDYGYYLPHYAVRPAVTQTSDGVLDVFQYDGKFGLMTFDGQGTYQDGDPLISMTSINSDSTLANLIGKPPSSGGSTYAGGEAGMPRPSSLPRSAAHLRRARGFGRSPPEAHPGTDGPLVDQGHLRPLRSPLPRPRAGHAGARRA